MEISEIKIINYNHLNLGQGKMPHVVYNMFSSCFYLKTRRKINIQEMDYFSPSENFIIFAGIRGYWIGSNGHFKSIQEWYE